MFVVLDEGAEQKLFQLAGARPPSDATPLLELTATLDAEEELIVVRVPEGGPAYTLSGTGETGADLRCFAFLVGPGRVPIYPVGLAAPGTSHLLVLAVAGPETPSLRAFFFPSQSAPPEACETEVVRLETDVFSRLKGVFDTRLLATSTNGTVWDPRDQRCGRAWVSCLRVRL
ncbi:MAG: hypothetical protein QGI56_07320 [Dehalococcoidia bacterium]|jgi:hypothetical protein|nr:hypothetical protein [Dehalococcoidia bacterium]MDP7510192.1 hypothetical protein [Dehalococcoidia bacterium]HJN88322.1 hypothetical protein [Dehalococcoidia bacterium]